MNSLEHSHHSFLRTPFRFNLLAFLVGIVSSQTIELAGTLKAGELLAFVYLLFIDKKTAISKVPSPIFLSAIAWAVAQLFSDVVNESNPLDAIKGIASPLVLLITLVGLISYLTRSSSRLPSFLLGLPLGDLAELFLRPRGYFAEGQNSWKWGYSGVVATLALVIYSFIIEPKLRPSLKISISDLFYLAVLILLTVISLGNESRSALINPLLFVAYLLLRIGKLERFIGFINYISQKTIFKPLVLVVSAFLMLNIAVSALFQNSLVLSLMPEVIQLKTLQQSDNRWGLLFGGRSEIAPSIVAFLDKPLLGHGSFAKDPTGAYTTLLYDFINQSGQVANYGYLDYIMRSTVELRVPTHSYLFAGLVWAGIAGGAFWIIVLTYVIRTLLDNYQILTYYFFDGGYALVWSIFFSPFGYTSRFSTAIFMAALISAVWLSKKINPLAKKMPY